MPKVNMYETPRGLAEHPWINTADTKYNPEGVFKDTLVLDHSLPSVLNLINLIDEQADEAFKRQTEGLSPGELKKWSVYKPYVIEEDENGDPTGRVKVNFKRNHWITLKGGEKRELQVSIYDSKGNVPADGKEPRIFGGTDHKVLFGFRDIKVPGTKQAGVKLDFAAIKVFALGGGRGTDPFSKGDDDGSDGYVWSPDDAHGHEEAEQNSEF